MPRTTKRKQQLQQARESKRIRVGTEQTSAVSDASSAATVVHSSISETPTETFHPADTLEATGELSFTSDRTDSELSLSVDPADTPLTVDTSLPADTSVDPADTSLTIDPADTSLTVDPADTSLTVDPADTSLTVDPASSTPSMPGASDTFNLDDLADRYSQEWIEELSRDDLMSLSIMLHCLLVKELNFQLTEAAVLIGKLLDRSDRTIREWRATFLANEGSFPDTLQGKYQRSGVLWHNEEMNKRATRYVRENAAIKGKPNLKLHNFTKWVNECLLPNYGLEPGYPRKVSCETARKWLHELGFQVIHAKKGSYVDGHERSDVVEYRGKFLRKMVALGFLREENAPTPEAKAALPTDLECPSTDVIEKTIVLFHDESTFQANDFEKTQWGKKDDCMLVPKSKGAGIMISDFICEQDGYLQLTEEEFAEGVKRIPNLKRYARASIEYGENKDGYWTSEKFMEQLEYCVQISECKYPREKGYKVVWIFDHSSCHGAYAEDALNASKMNARPGGKQPKMRDTVWEGKQQTMVFSIGVPKGLIQVLKERGKYRPGMKLEEMRAEIATHPDFKNEKTRIEHFLNSKGYSCIFLPKFHCELNPIERDWAQAKRYTRAHCDYSIVGLRRNVPLALDTVTVDNIINHYRKIRHYMFGYLQGLSGGPELEKQVKYMKKIYTSHRRVADTVIDP